MGPAHHRGPAHDAELLSAIFLSYRQEIKGTGKMATLTRRRGNGGGKRTPGRLRQPKSQRTPGWLDETRRRLLFDCCNAAAQRPLQRPRRDACGIYQEQRCSKRMARGMGIGNTVHGKEEWHHADCNRSPASFMFWFDRRSQSV